jgi:hypothetical protein
MPGRQEEERHDRGADQPQGQAEDRVDELQSQDETDHIPGRAQENGIQGQGGRRGEKAEEPSADQAGAESDLQVIAEFFPEGLRVDLSVHLGAQSSSPRAAARMDRGAKSSSRTRMRQPLSIASAA